MMIFLKKELPNNPVLTFYSIRTTVNINFSFSYLRTPRPIVCIEGLGFFTIFCKALIMSPKAVVISSIAKGTVVVTVSTTA